MALYSLNEKIKNKNLNIVKQNKEQRKRCDLSCRLKVSTDFEPFTTIGNAFHRRGAATAKVDLRNFLARHAFVFPLSLPFRSLSRRLYTALITVIVNHGHAKINETVTLATGILLPTN